MEPFHAPRSVAPTDHGPNCSLILERLERRAVRRRVPTISVRVGMTQLRGGELRHMRVLRG